MMLMPMPIRSRPIEPLLWMLFSAGGVLAALVMPIFVLLFALAFPLGWIAPPPHDALLGVLRHPLTRAGVFVLCTLSLFHWAHRFRYTLYDGLQIKQLDELINTLCYGGAIAGSLVAAWLLWRVP
jgi:fumarate reductase subunit D